MGHGSGARRRIPIKIPEKNRNEISSRAVLLNGQYKVPVAPIMAACSLTVQPMAALTIAVSHNTRDRCAAVSSSLALVRGIPNTERGVNAADTTATGFLTPASEVTSEAATPSASAVFRWFS